MNVVLVTLKFRRTRATLPVPAAPRGAELHLVRPLGFSLDDKYMKRGGPGLLVYDKDYRIR